MIRCAKLAIALIAFSVALESPQIGVCSGNLRTVALTGIPAPDTGADISFSEFLAGPDLNNRGETAFAARLTGGDTSSANNAGVWSEGGDGLLKLVARTGSQAPGMDPGVNFTSIGSGGRGFAGQLVLNDRGEVAFNGFAGVAGIWSEGGGPLALEAKVSAQAPGTPAGVFFSGFNFSVGSNGLLQNNNGSVGFSAFLNGSGVSGTNSSGIWQGGGGAPMRLVARGGSPAPGTTANFGDLFSSSPVMNNLGQTAFLASLVGPGVTGTNSSTVWSERGGNLTLIARGGDQAPGAPAGVNFASFTFYPAQNDAGDVGFTATLTGPGVTSLNNLGVWADRGEGLELVARYGNQAPGTEPGVNFLWRFAERVMNARGEMAFVSALTGPGVTILNDTGIWSESGGQGLRLVARSGDPAPELPGQTIGSIQDIAGPVLNSRGMTAFIAPLGTISGPRAIFAENRFNELRLIARVGGLLDVSDDPLSPDLRTIADLSFANHSGNQDGRQSGFNDLGQLAFFARFSDGSSGIFVSDRVAIPEPALGTLFSLLFVAMAARRGRSRIFI